VVFTEAEIAYLGSQRLGRLATARADGTLQASPVGFGYNAGLYTIDIGGRDMAGSRKYRNVGEHPDVAFVVDDVVSVTPWQVRCLEIRGTAEAIESPTDSAAPTPGSIIRIHPVRIISWGIDAAAGLGKRNVQR
jgi:pyridoxamine 5'-phosphate oxidase family protein